MVDYPIIYKALYIPTGLALGFLNHQQFVSSEKVPLRVPDNKDQRRSQNDDHLGPPKDGGNSVSTIYL